MRTFIPNTFPLTLTNLQYMNGKVALFVGLLAACYVMPAISFTSHLWAREHYRFFVVVLPLILWMFWVEMPLKPIRARRFQRSFRNIILGVAGVTLATTAFVNSPWLCGVAIFFGLLSVSLWFRGSKQRFHLVAVSCLFLLLLPFPLNYDLILIQGLQTQASAIASQLLDIVGVWHLMRGNLMVLEDKSFFVEEACAGVHSLFALATAVSVFCVWTRRHWFASTLLIATSLFWALLTNVFRIAFIAIVWHWAAVDWSTGWQHELLGMVLFAIACGLCWSTACLFRFAVPESRQSNVASASQNKQSVVAETPGAGSTINPVENRNRWLTNRLVATASALAVLMFIGYLTRPSMPVAIYDSIEVERLSKCFVPDLFQELEQSEVKTVSFESVEREMMSSWGKHSRIWKLAGDQWQAELSVDYLWQSQHDLRVCYTGNGWTIDAESFDDAQPEWPIAILELSRRGGDRAVVFYSLLDSEGGAQINPIRNLDSDFGSRLRSELARFAREASGVVQVQMYLRDADRQSPAFVSALADYRRLRQVVRNNMPASITEGASHVQ